MIQLNDEQQRVMESLEDFRLKSRQLEESDLIFVLAGYAGTGKTTVISEFVNMYPKHTLVTASTHKAKNVLMRKVDNPDVEFNTLHSALGLREEILADGSREFIPSGQDKLDGVRLLIVDEASMVNKSLVQYALDASYDYHLPIVFVGDSFQLPPVKESFSPVFDATWQRDVKARTETLSTIVRQAAGNPIIEASMNIRQSPLEISKQQLYSMLAPKQTELGSLTHAPNLDNYLEMFHNPDGDFAKVVCYTNANVRKYNEAIRSYLKPGVTDVIAVGDRIILTEPLVEDNISLLDNNTEAWVMAVKEDTFNVAGIDIPCYLCEISPDHVKQTFKIRVPTPEGAHVHKQLVLGLSERAKEAPKGSMTAKGYWQDFWKVKRVFIEWQHGYDLTTHRAQGSTFTNAILDIADMWKNRNAYERNRLIYTALTRASNNVSLMW